MSKKTTCKNCGHHEDEHKTPIGGKWIYGRCWQGIGFGNRCECRDFEKEEER